MSSHSLERHSRSVSFVLLLSLVTNSSQPLEAELAAVASRSVDSDGNFVMDPSSIEILKTHARQQCGHLGKKFQFHSPSLHSYE